MIYLQCRSFVLHLSFFVACLCLFGCGDPRLKPDLNWIPNSVGGPIEVKPLPTATNLSEHYQQWIESSQVAKVHLYDVLIEQSSEQSNFKWEVAKPKGPAGRVTRTFVSFVFKNATNGPYLMEWVANGAQNAELVRVGAKPKRFLLRVIQIRDIPMPRLQIVAIEGVEADGQLVAVHESEVP
jgi:hypothetical protein